MKPRLNPSELRGNYQRFLAPGRVLLTGHSHQAWPDVAREGQLRAFDDAALLADDKWSRALEAAESVRSFIAKRIDGTEKQIALAGSTHELVVRFLSALPFDKRRKIVTTDGEFHGIFRQAKRLREAGVEVVFVAARPVQTLAERLVAALDEHTAAVLCSTVLFETSEVVPGLASVTEAAQRVGVEVLYDAYHAFGIVPFALSELGEAPFFLVAGGYKYAQWGEGNCWMHVPASTTLRPVYSGWWVDFAELEAPRSFAPVGWGTSLADRFAGSTYDPTSHYRARSVCEFFDQNALTVPRLRELSLTQTERLCTGLEGYDVRTPREVSLRGGFVTVRVSEAHEVVQALRAKNIVVDARGSLLRFGPAPYTTDDELDEAVQAFRSIVKK